MLKFQLGDKSVILKDDPSLGRSLISLKAMIKTIRRGGYEFLIECNHMTATEELRSRMVRTNGYQLICVLLLSDMGRFSVCWLVYPHQGDMSMRLH